jgi:putative membrane protein
MNNEGKYMSKSHKLVYALFVVIWIVMAINPKYPQDWLLENVLIFIFFPFLFFMDKKHHYTLLSIIFLLIFASLHSLGSHYTYAEMEHFDVITQFFGFERNHFDRLVHFLFGLLTFRVLFEMITEGTNTVRTALLFTFTMIVSISTVYELLEWLAAAILRPDLGMAFLGTQGDVWDAHKDTALATAGALINIAFYQSYKHLWLSKKNQDL